MCALDNRRFARKLMKGALVASKESILALRLYAQHSKLIDGRVSVLCVAPTNADSAAEL